MVNGQQIELGNVDKSRVRSDLDNLKNKFSPFSPPAARAFSRLELDFERAKKKKVSSFSLSFCLLLWNLEEALRDAFEIFRIELFPSFFIQSVVESARVSELICLLILKCAAFFSKLVAFSKFD